DAEGNKVNPHIPSFISKAPWYLDTGAKSSLKHQRLDSDGSQGAAQSGWYDRTLKTTGPAATKYRKGACENCGALTHKTKECLERPRKRGARWTGEDIQHDEVIQEVKMTWDGKRDVANGYDFDSHAQVLKERFDRVDAMRKEKGLEGAVDTAVGSDELNPTKLTDVTKAATSNHMRQREDVAKYLKPDYDVDSYNPKAKKVRTEDERQSAFTRAADRTGDVATFETLQSFAWTGEHAANAVHANSTPSQAALLFKKQQEARRIAAEAQKEVLAARYGNVTQALPKNLVEEEAANGSMNADGTEKVTVRKSRYQEDVLKNGHSSVWGSWFDAKTFSWGYRCCHNTLENAYCT
ncbi:Pre-mRNA splicing Prp18-interacting factor-domain-containing protein, partial [Protomyces lactucae-debilis]